MAPKKNIADKMIAEYNAIRLEKDDGKKLLKLVALDARVGALVDNKEVEIGSLKGVGIPTIAGAGVAALLVSSGVANISDASGVVEYALVSTLGGFIGCFGGVVSMPAWESKANKAINDRRAVRYVKNVLPHLPKLKSLAKEIENDRKAILKSDHVLSLQDSPHLPQLIKAYPSLMKTFEAAQNAQPLPKINEAPEDKPPQMTL